jgi:hypothetical protein
MIEHLLNQEAGWKRKTGTNQYGKPIYADSVTIAVRWEESVNLVKDEKGNDVTSKSMVFCIEPVNWGDILTDGTKEWPVLSLQKIPNLEGEIPFREVYL